MHNHIMESKEFDKNKITEKALAPYKKSFSPLNLQKKLLKYGQVIGINIIYKVLQLWYVLQKPDVPAQTKAVIMGALGYLISPLDFLPDLTPFLGYNDDLAAIMFTLVLVQQYIDDDVKAKARKKLSKFFDEETISKLD